MLDADADSRLAPIAAASMVMEGCSHSVVGLLHGDRFLAKVVVLEEDRGRSIEEEEETMNDTSKLLVSPSQSCFGRDNDTDTVIIPKRRITKRQQ